MVWQPNILNNCYELSGGYAPPEPPTRGSAHGPRWGTSVPPSALEVFLNDMRYINPRFTYLLLLTYPLCPHLQILAAPLTATLLCNEKST